MPLDSSEISGPAPETFKLPCGALKSNIKAGIYSISDGFYRKERPYGISFAPGVGNENELLSGEAIIFPEDRAVTFIMGRGDSADVKFDSDLIPYSKFKEEFGYDIELIASFERLQERLRVANQEELEIVVDLGDLGISRCHLQVAVHPYGVATVTYDPALGGHTPEAVKERGEKINFPKILRNYKPQASIDEISWVFGSGSATLKHGDVVIVKGNRRTYCFRYFETEKKDISGSKRERKLIKQSYPKDVTVEQLHQQLMVESAE